MIKIQNTLNVERLFLTWQSNTDRHKRYFVGSIIKTKSDTYEFSYSVETPDFTEACNAGFVGYPAFKLNDSVYSNDVMTTFMKRLPPRSRRDFTKYLSSHHLSSTSIVNDFELISHTGIQLPSDGFDLVPDLSEAIIPFDYLLEIAGTRYHMDFDQVQALDEGIEVSFQCEDENKVDSNAVAIFIGDKKLGFINRLMCKSIRAILCNGSIKGYVAKKSGTPERPLIYIMISAR